MVGPECRGFRIHSNDLNLLAALFQEFPGSRNGATGTCCCHKVCETSFRLFPNFRTCGEVVRLGIPFIKILVEIVRPRNGFGQFLCFAVVRIRVVSGHFGRAFDNRGTQRPHHLNFVGRCRIFYRKNAFVSLHRTDHGNTEACIPRGGFDNCTSRA